MRFNGSGGARAVTCETLSGPARQLTSGVENRIVRDKIYHPILHGEIRELIFSILYD